MVTSAAALCLGPNGGGALEIQQLPRQEPGPDEIEIAVEAASVNPIDVRRSEGYGRRLLSSLDAARFPLVLGNDFGGSVSAVGARVSALRIGDRVYGVKPLAPVTCRAGGLRQMGSNGLSLLLTSA